MGFSGSIAAGLLFIVPMYSMTIDMLDVSSMEPIEPNYCNNSDLLATAGIYRSTLGQFLGFDCSQEFFHCRWQSDGFRTYRKLCKTGLVYDVHGTQNCNYDYNVKSCGITGNGPAQCNATDFLCPLSGQCVHMSERCDGRYDCVLEEDEQNCPLCAAGEFACIVSEQCIPLDRRCNGLSECADGTDEKDCDVCGHGFFHCSKSNECVPIDQRCDGRRQCPHGEDEMLCKKPAAETKFTCQSRDQNIPMTQVCDGVPQCNDGSDEAYCDVNAGVGNSISFSSNPNPSNPQGKPASGIPLAPVPQPQPTQEEEEEYEYEEEPEKQGPSFPMLALVTPPPPPIIQTTAVPQTPRTYPPTPPPTIPPTSSRPVTVFSRPRPKISPPQQMKQAVSVIPRLVQPVEITAPTTLRSATRATTVRPPASESQGIRIRYPTKTASEIADNVRFTPSTVRPRNQNAQQLYDKTVSTTKVSTHSTPQHALIVEVTSPPIPAQQIKENVMRQLHSQISNGMTPELMAKIERLLANELRGTRRRRPTSPREASLSPTALIRTFTSKVQMP